MERLRLSCLVKRLAPPPLNLSTPSVQGQIQLLPAYSCERAAGTLLLKERP